MATIRFSNGSTISAGGSCVLLTGGLALPGTMAYASDLGGGTFALHRADGSTIRTRMFTTTTVAKPAPGVDVLVNDGSGRFAVLRCWKFGNL